MTRLWKRPSASRTIIHPNKSGNRPVAFRKSEASSASLFFYNEIMEHHEHMNHMAHMDHEKMTRSGHDHQHTGHSAMVEDFKRRFWISLIITLPILALSPVIQQFLHLGTSLRFSGDAYVLWALSSLVYFFGGFPFLKGIFGELKSRRPGMMTLIAVAITTAWVYSSAVVFGLRGDVFFWELATLIDIMLLGHWLEMRSVISASSALEELARLMPAEAHKMVESGDIADIPLDQLAAGDRVLVKPGEKVPADGVVIKGETSITEAMLTGESNPVNKTINSGVIGGSINGEGSIIIEVHKTGKDSYLAQVTELVKAAQESKSKTQNLADRAAFGLTVTALSIGIITLLVWITLAHQEFVFALSRMVTVMVITCPHALGLAIPLVVAVSTSLSAKNGLLIKNRDSFEHARKIQAIIFDKTGTLTLGKFGVTDVISFDRMPEKEILKYAASVESNSEHPIAKSIISGSEEVFPVEGFKSVPGKGAQGKVNGREVLVVSLGYLREKNMHFTNEIMGKLASQGKTVVFVLIDGKIQGLIALADTIRQESKKSVLELKGMGIKCLMLTGDNRLVAKQVAEEIGIEEYFAEVLPDQKAEKVKEIQSRGLKVAMVGDGVNDAPALAQADLGIAIGAGTDVAVATADVVLVKSNTGDIISILKLSKATYRKMVQNLAWATGYNIFAIPLAAGVAYSAGVLLDPALGAALMALSTIIVAINARLIRI